MYFITSKDLPGATTGPIVYPPSALAIGATAKKPNKPATVSKARMVSADVARFTAAQTAQMPSAEASDAADAIESQTDDTPADVAKDQPNDDDQPFPEESADDLVNLEQYTGDDDLEKELTTEDVDITEGLPEDALQNREEDNSFVF